MGSGQRRQLDSQAGRNALIRFMGTHFGLRGIQSQLSAVTAERLAAALREPEKHRDLVVRVAGYSDYFVRQSPERQAYILAREKYAEV